MCDERLAGDTSMACASCRQPGKVFSEGETLSAPYAGAGRFRGTANPANVGYRETWLHDGHFGTSLNDVTREMITELSSLPQVLPELTGDPVFAAGMFGPIDDRFGNLPD